jgi:hypothetical protein
MQDGKSEMEQKRDINHKKTSKKSKCPKEFDNKESK